MAKPKIPPQALKALKGQVEDPQLAEIGSYFVALKGGTEAFARLLIEEFDMAKPGSMPRKGILEMVMAMLKFSNERNRTPDDYGLIGDDDLVAEHEKLTAKTNGGPSEESLDSPAV